MYLDEHAVAFIDTSEDEPHELEYGLPEETLTRYLNYINAGKFVVDTLCELGGYGHGSAIEGWSYQGHFPFEMECKQDVWNQLIDLVDSRIPGSPLNKANKVLVSPSIFDRYPSVPLLARDFLSRARKPPFKIIAPELQMPDDDLVHYEVFQLGLLYGPASDPSQI